MVERGPSKWPVLFDLAMEIFGHFERAIGFVPSWSFGGGTALMLQIDHRESHDIDIFLDDPQVMPFLNPVTQDFALTRLPDEYKSDGTQALKLAYDALGEIDFICSSSILDVSSERYEIRGRMVDLETPAEIAAKKVYFRGWNLQPRDMFDLAAIAEHHGDDYVVSALRECGHERCRRALEVVEKVNPKAVETVIGQLLYREKNSHLVADAQAITHRILTASLTDKAEHVGSED